MLLQQTIIHERFPTFRIEKGFSEEDERWTKDHRETNGEMQARGHRALDRLFGENGAKETCKWMIPDARMGNL
jgi:hypothetical protein